MLSRADSYLDEALKLDCDERGDGSWGLSGPASTSPSTADDALLGAAADVASHDYTTVDVLAAERAVGVDRVAD